MNRLYGTPWDPPEGTGECHWEKGCPRFPLELVISETEG